MQLFEPGEKRQNQCRFSRFYYLYIKGGGVDVQQYEDRIPQIKNQRPKRKANRKLLFLLTVFFLAILIVLFVRSPYSKVSQIRVSGNEVYSEQQIVAASGLTIGMQFLNVWQSSVQENESKLAGIKQVTIDRQFPGIINLNVVEHRRVAFYFTPDGNQKLLLENGLVIPETRPGERVVDRPLVRSWNSAPLLIPLAKSLSQLSVALLSEISDIALTPTAYDKERITLYMRDGNEVRTIIHMIDSRLPWYPSIAKELPKDEKGVVFMLESTWFSKYGSVQAPTDQPQDGAAESIPNHSEAAGNAQQSTQQTQGQSGSQGSQTNGQTDAETNGQTGDQTNAETNGQADAQQQPTGKKRIFE